LKPKGDASRLHSTSVLSSSFTSSFLPSIPLFCSYLSHAFLCLNRVYIKAVNSVHIHPPPAGGTLPSTNLTNVWTLFPLN
jgi:hypothetical protein